MSVNKLSGKVVPVESYQEVCRLNDIFVRKNSLLVKENEELKKKLELLKDFEFLKMLFK